MWCKAGRIKGKRQAEGIKSAQFQSVQFPTHRSGHRNRRRNDRQSISEDYPD